MQQENHKLPRAFAMATNAPLEPIVVVIVHVSHPYQRVDHTYAFIILFLVFILMCLAVVVFNIELNAPLAILILVKISSSHFPFDVIVCPK